MIDGFEKSLSTLKLFKDIKIFSNVYYRILEYFYKKNEKDTNCGLQWTCYSEGCFLKDHNDGQGDTYQNTCAILIYLNLKNIFFLTYAPAITCVYFVQ